MESTGRIKGFRPRQVLRTKMDRMMLRATLSGCNWQIGKAASKIGQNGKNLLRRPWLPWSCSALRRRRVINQRCVTSQKNEGLPSEFRRKPEMTLHSCCQYLRLQLSMLCLQSRNIFCAVQSWRVAQTGLSQLSLAFYTCYRTSQLSWIRIWTWK
jgi:hypothetical protein